MECGISDVPLITVSGAVDEPGQAPEGSSGDMGPPSIAGPSSEQQGSEQVDEMESEDGVSNFYIVNYYI